MKERYYIPDLPLLRKHIDKSAKALIVPEEKNIIELGSDEEKEQFISSIKKAEFFNDSELLTNVKKSLPGVDKYLNRTPISQPDLMEALMFIFNDFPPDLFEEDTVLEGLRKFFNHFVRKNEITFIISNIKNKTLLYDKKWKHKKYQEFYFQMKKLAYNLDTYYAFFCNTQFLLRDIFLREISFGDEKITGKKQEVLNRVFNISGNNLLDLKKRLIYVKNQIKNNRMTLQRSNISLPKKYSVMEKEALRKIDATLKDLDEKIQKTKDSKKELREEVRKRHGFFSKETVRKILKESKWFRPFIKD